MSSYGRRFSIVFLILVAFSLSWETAISVELADDSVVQDDRVEFHLQAQQGLCRRVVLFSEPAVTTARAIELIMDGAYEEQYAFDVSGSGCLIRSDSEESPRFFVFSAKGYPRYDVERFLRNLSLWVAGTESSLRVQGSPGLQSCIQDPMTRVEMVWDDDSGEGDTLRVDFSTSQCGQQIGLVELDVFGIVSLRTMEMELKSEVFGRDP
jgi:hypothetical protein